MAKRRSRASSRHQTGTTISSKSWFGSHSDMVVEELSDKEVICEDQRGQYITYKSRLDNGLADPRRFESNRIIPDDVSSSHD